jgi:hypothetical protein
MERKHRSKDWSVGKALYAAAYLSIYLSERSFPAVPVLESEQVLQDAHCFRHSEIR